MPENSSERAGSDDFGMVDAFSLLGNEKRLSIVSVLHGGSLTTPVSFSTIYDHVDVDDSAQFNYHLKKLVPHFVSKDEEGYELTSAGRRIARAVAAGTYTEIPHVDPFPIDGNCYACGDAALQASYEDELFSIRCTACTERVLAVRVPPTVVRGREPDDLVDAFERWSRFQVEQARHGLCPDCGGETEPEIEGDVHESIAFDAVATFACTVCGRRAMTSFGVIASRHPVVQEFYERRGASLHERRIWEIEQYIAGEHVEVLGSDPWQVRVSFYTDGDACHVEIDETLRVVDTDIVTGVSPSEE